MNNRHKENSITASIKGKYDKRSNNMINGSIKAQNTEDEIITLIVRVSCVLFFDLN
jgi:hypothetical protein